MVQTTTTTTTGLLGSQVFARSFIRSNPLDTPVALERRTFHSIGMWHIIMLSVTTAYRFGYAYIYMAHLLFHLLAVLLDRLLTPSGGGAIGSLHPIKPLSYLVALIVPFALNFKHALAGLNLFVPLTGRMGPNTPVDVIVGVVVGFGGTHLLPLFVSWSARLSVKVLRRIWIKWLVMYGIVVAVFAFASFPYDSAHPKVCFGTFSYLNFSLKETLTKSFLEL
jgi:hypothetical protein